MSMVVELNVGGTKFVTTKETLSSDGGNWFTNALSASSDPAKPLFIDRDATRFAVVLNFLRTKRVALNGLSLVDVQEEALFFQMPRLAKARMEFCSVESCSCFSEQHSTFCVQGPANAQHRSFRFEQKGNYADCLNYVNQLIAAGWNVVSVSPTKDPISKPFKWFLSRVVVP